MSDRYPVIIIGGGQAGLSVSYCLKQRGIEHIVFEKHTIGHEWRSRRWDTFCLVTPNWQCQLPGYPYPGNNPYGFMSKDEIVKYLEDYATSFDPPIKAGVTVTKVSQTETGLFSVNTDIGEYICDRVVIAVSGYHTPKIPRLAERLPTQIYQLHSSA
jgi:putative flavoprotein involved in K+ transport